ncbi:MAG: hypothetical protein WDZ90_01370 [Candidatus Paceibacterota bacterium]
MELTIFLAQIIGVYMLVGGLSGLLYADRMQKAMAEIKNSYILPYFDGTIALFVGLLIVLTHNVWEGAAAIIVTLVGWLAVLEGVAMMLLPHDTIMQIAGRLSSRNTAMGFSVIAILAGGYLVWFSFFV